MSAGFELDLSIAPARDSIKTVREQAITAESMGFTTVSIAELNGWNVFPVLATWAIDTETIVISNDACSVYARSPAMLAQSALTLQELSDGRHRICLASSSPAAVEGWHGEEFDRPLRRVRETIDIMRQVFAGGSVDYDGDLFDLGGMAYERSIPAASPAIDVAGLGPKMVELIGRFADGWVPQLFTPAGLSDRLEDLRRGADLGDRDVEEIRVSPLVRCFAHEDRAYAQRQAREEIAFILGAYGPYYGNSLAKQGYGDVVAELRSAWEDRDTEAMTEALPLELLHELVAVGTPEEVTAFVREYGAIDGVSAVRVGALPSMSAAEQRETLNVLGDLA